MSWAEKVARGPERGLDVCSPWRGQAALHDGDSVPRGGGQAQGWAFLAQGPEKEEGDRAVHRPRARFSGLIVIWDEREPQR